MNDIRDNIISILMEKGLSQENAELAADVLVAKGATFRPCEVGDTVYIHFASRSEKNVSVRTRKVRDVIYIRNQWYIITDGDGAYRQVDKDVFLSKYKAKKVLLESGGINNA